MRELLLSVQDFMSNMQDNMARCSRKFKIICAVFIVSLTPILFVAIQVNTDVLRKVNEEEKFELKGIGLNLFEFIGVSHGARQDVLVGSSSIISNCVSIISVLGLFFVFSDLFIRKTVTGITIEPGDKGKDLEIMGRYYKDATRIIVFAGSFDWIAKDNNFREIITKLSNENKIKLVSYKTEETVKSAMHDDAFFESIRINMIFRSGVEIKCSYVTWEGGEAVLYNNKDGPDSKPMIFIIKSNETTKKIVGLLSEFMKKTIYDKGND